MGEKRKINVELNLYEEDLKKVLNICGAHDLELGQLLENFISDLVDGKQRNGSDEVDLAGKWFQRCWFGMFPEETFLRYVINYNGVEVVYNAICEMEEMEEYLKKIENDPEYEKEYIYDCKQKICERKETVLEFYNDYVTESKDAQEWPAAIASVKEYGAKFEQFFDFEE